MHYIKCMLEGFLKCIYIYYWWCHSGLDKIILIFCSHSQQGITKEHTWEQCYIKLKCQFLSLSHTQTQVKDDLSCIYLTFCIHVTSSIYSITTEGICVWWCSPAWVSDSRSSTCLVFSCSTLHRSITSSLSTVSFFPTISKNTAMWFISAFVLHHTVSDWILYFHALSYSTYKGQ